MPHFYRSSSSWSKRIVLAVVYACLLLFPTSKAQGNDEGVFRHQVNVWYTWIAPSNSTATLAQASTIQEINNKDGEYEYSDVPTTPAPSGMELHLNVNLTHIRIEIRQPPTSATPYTDRLYVAFYWPLLLADLSTPAVLPEELLSFQALESNTSIPFVDPGSPSLDLEASLDEGALLVEFINISASNAQFLPSVMEFTYLLEIAPSSAPTHWPTLGPTLTLNPTLFPTTSSMPSPGPPSPLDDITPTSSPTNNSGAAVPSRFLFLVFQAVGLASSLVAAWCLT